MKFLFKHRATYTVLLAGFILSDVAGNCFSRAAHRPVLINHCLTLLTDWIPALCPSAAQYGGERGF